MLGIACMLFGCTEDIICGNPDVHQAEYEEAPYVRTMCPECRVPICDDCDKKLRRHDSKSKFQDGGTIPMTLSNDHYYGHVSRYIVENNVTWLECAASCMIWSTMLVYYLEAPFGHLMGEEMGNPQGRTHVRGNLFSFNMPWEDIERCCHQAVLHANSPDQQALKRLPYELGVPHSEETLALLVMSLVENSSCNVGSAVLAYQAGRATEQPGWLRNISRLRLPPG